MTGNAFSVLICQDKFIYRQSSSTNEELAIPEFQARATQSGNINLPIIAHLCEGMMNR
jgi:hypothetical protein